MCIFVHTINGIYRLELVRSACNLITNKCYVKKLQFVLTVCKNFPYKVFMCENWSWVDICWKIRPLWRRLVWIVSLFSLRECKPRLHMPRPMILELDLLIGISADVNSLAGRHPAPHDCRVPSVRIQENTTILYSVPYRAWCCWGGGE